PRGPVAHAAAPRQPRARRPEIPPPARRPPPRYPRRQGRGSLIRGPLPRTQPQTLTNRVAARESRSLPDACANPSLATSQIACPPLLSRRLREPSPATSQIASSPSHAPVRNPHRQG